MANKRAYASARIVKVDFRGKNNGHGGTHSLCERVCAHVHRYTQTYAHVLALRAKSIIYAWDACRPRDSHKRLTIQARSRQSVFIVLLFTY